MRVLVTGGSGFIGSHVVDRLLADGHEARVFDMLACAGAPRERCEHVVGDLLDPAVLLDAATGCDTIIHLAAAADVGLVAKDPTGAEALNSRGTLNVLEAARTTGARVIYASTIWVYSDVRQTEVDEDSELGLPSHLYTATKLAGEMYCRSYGELYSVDTTILRFGIPYGPRARPAAVLPIFVNKALAGEPLTIAGDGLQTRRFVYVEDLADGVVRALEPQASGRIYNLVGAEETSVRDIAEAVRGAVGDVSIVHTKGRAGDFAGATICGERAATELDWRPRTSFAEGVRHYVAWHRADAAEREQRAAGAVAGTVVAQPAAAAPATIVAQPAVAVAIATVAAEPGVAAETATAAASAGDASSPGPASSSARLNSRPTRARRMLRRATPYTPPAISGILALIVYGFVLHAAGLLDDEGHTVIVVAALVVVATLSTRTTQARIAVWLTAAVGAVLLIPPQPTGILDMARLNLPLLALAIAGAGFVLLAAASGRRTLELAEQGE